MTTVNSTKSSVEGSFATVQRTISVWDRIRCGKEARRRESRQTPALSPHASAISRD